MRIVVANSRRSAILWECHTILDQFAANGHWRELFVNEVLRRLGASDRQRATFVPRFASELPREIGDVDPAALLDSMAHARVFEWDDDLTKLAVSVKHRAVERCTAILVERARPSMPQPVGAALASTLRDVLALDLAHVEDEIIGILIRDLWRVDGKEAQLAEEIVERVALASKLAFVDVPER